MSFQPRPFRAPWWLRSAHAQTLAGKLLRPSPAIRLRRERWTLPDSDFLDLDFVEDGDPGPRRLALVLHGLEGSARRPYALLAYRALADHGIRAVGLNFRGCSGEPNRTHRFYHSGATDDVRWVVERLRQRFPHVPLGAVGFSLGGNVLLKLLGELDDEGPATFGGCVAISVPFDLGRGADRLEEGPMGRLYTHYFMRNLRRKAAAKEALIAGHCDVARVLRARTIRAFDDAATAPLHGFDDADDYYRRSSSAAFLARIRVPTLLLHSRDDPFLPAAAVPEKAMDANPCITAALTERGGHVGFIEGTPWAPRFWAETEAARFLSWRLS